jgi:hypothetical protein
MLFMPAWIAGIQLRKDASGDIRVNLDSSTPCRNDAIEGALLEATEVPLPTYFRRSARRPRRPDNGEYTESEKMFSSFVLFVTFVVNPSSQENQNNLFKILPLE